MSDGVELRLAEPGDYEAIGEITVQAYAHDGYLREGDDYAVQLRDAASRARDGELWVAVDSESRRLLGTVTFCPAGSPYRELASDDDGEFRMLAVAPAARGEGVGRLLAEHCLQRSRDLGFGGVVICSLPAMTRAHALYVSQGFARDVTLDWEPVEGVVLWGFRTSFSD